MRREIGLALLLAAGAAKGADAGRPVETARPSMPPPPAGEPNPQGRASAYYREDADGRRVARIDAAVVAEGETVRLRLSASAVDPLVEPPPGDRGVAGENEVTARELTAVLAEGRLSVRLRDEAGRVSPSEVRATERGRLSRRRVEPDGRIAFVPASARDHVLAFAAESAPLRRGTSTFDFVVDGRVVVRATVFVGAGRSDIRSLECPGESGPKADAP
jgi:hypothetical protein